MHRPLARILLVVLAVAALAAGGIALNLLLLGQADSRNDPVGKLTPRANISQPTPRAPTPTTTHEQTETEVEEPDDQGYNRVRRSPLEAPAPDAVARG